MAYDPTRPLQNTDIVKGSVFQVKIGNDILGFATQHNVSIQTSTSEIQTKDHGDFPAVLAQNITWTVQCDNLYTDENEEALMRIVTAKQLVDISFAKVNNYDAKGIVDNNTPNTWTVGDAILTGKAYLTDFQMNTAAGDSATISCTFTGCGSFSTPNLDNA